MPTSNIVPLRVPKTQSPWQVQWIKFTKAMARVALAKYRRDRKNDPAHVWALTQTMNLGLWDIYSYGQVPLAFDTEGYRLNGGHRLRAFLASNLATLVFPVVKGCEPEAWAKFDLNIKVRRQSAAHLDRKHAARDIARINAFVGLITGQVRTKIEGPLADFYLDGEYAEDIAWAGEVFPVAQALTRASRTAAFMYVRRVDAPFATEMADAWLNGIGRGLTRQLVQLRDEALRTEGAGSGGITREAAAQTVRRTLNALAMKHKGVTKGMTTGAWGLDYFSAKLNDGVAALWKATLTTPEGEGDEEQQP